MLRWAAAVTTPVRVVLASHRYPPATGGSERWAELLATGLARRGISTTVVTSLEPGASASEERDGVQVLRLPLRPFLAWRRPVGYLALLRSLNADVFHLSGNRIWCVDYYLPHSRSFSWAHVMTGHGFYQFAMHPRFWDRWYFRRYLPRRLQGIDAYAALTEFERTQLLSWGVEPARLVTIPQGLDVGEFGTPPPTVEQVRARWSLSAPNVAVYAGGFFANKRVDRLVRVVARTAGRWALVAMGPDVPGSPYGRGAVTSLARSLGAELRVVDIVPRADVVAALFAADVAVLGSEYEGFGYFLLEAMAAGRPFVAFPSGAAPELAASGGGIVAGSEEAFAAALGSLEDPATRAGMGARGRASIGDWSADRMVDRYVALYERLLRSRRGPTG